MAASSAQKIKKNYQFFPWKLKILCSIPIPEFADHKFHDMILVDSSADPKDFYLYHQFIRDSKS